MVKMNEKYNRCSYQVSRIKYMNKYVHKKRKIT